MGHLADRLETRAPPAVADRAWELLRHPHVLGSFLQRQLPPSQTGRFALPLSDADPAPHLVVTPDGRGVTCLAAGMITDSPRIPWPRVAAYLDAQAQDLRQRVASGRLAADASLHESLERSVQRAYRMTRAEFDRVRLLAPLLHDLLREMLDKQLRRLERVSNESRRLARYAVDAHADAEWSLYTAACTMLLACANEPGVEIPAVMSMSPLDPLLSGRGLWVLVNWPERTLALADRCLREDRRSFMPYLRGALSCIGWRFAWHRRAAEQARATMLAVTRQDFVTPPGLTLTRQDWLEQALDVARDSARAGLPQDPPAPAPLRNAEERDLLKDLQRAAAGDPAVLRELDRLDPVRGLFSDPVERRWPPPHLPAVVDPAAFWQRHMLHATEESPFMELSVGLWWSNASLDALAPPPEPDPLWSAADGRAYVRETLVRNLRGPQPREPDRAAPKPGRNEPCSCGSGKKFKRCCGA